MPTLPESIILILSTNVGVLPAELASAVLNTKAPEPELPVAEGVIPCIDAFAAVYAPV